MKRNVLAALVLLTSTVAVNSQVTRLSNNTSYDLGVPLNNSKIVLRSGVDNGLWSYDIAGNSFVQLNSLLTVATDFPVGVLNGKMYFAGSTAATGTELWVTDGTIAGTSLVKDINPTGAADSNPDYGFVVYNSELYFTASDGVSGRELWKTNGTAVGTVRVKDINAGPMDAFSFSAQPIFGTVNGLLVFTASTLADGDELWATNGTDAGTTQIKSIYPGSYGSHISGMTELNGSLLFAAFDDTNGQAIWKTDGTAGGTSLVADIDPTPPTPPIPPFPPFYIPSIIPLFFNFQGALYFSGNNGTDGFELWKTDGTGGGTQMVKDIYPGSFNDVPNNGVTVLLAVKNNSRFFFTAIDGVNGSEIWQSDGTANGTTLLKDIVAGPTGSEPVIFPSFTGSLFQGNKFFFIATTPGVEGEEFYVSDGTAAGTTMLRDINPGANSGVDATNLSAFYTADKFYFTANNGSNGNELWQSNGVPGLAGTTMVADINSTAAGAGSDVVFATIAANTLYFFGTDGDNPALTDFFKLDGTVSALPLLWTSVEARPVDNDVLISWKTAAEDITNYFLVQRSENGTVFEDIGKVNAVGSGANSYQFRDINAMKAGVKKWYYRVKYVDKDARSAISRIMTISLNRLIASIQLRPNPVLTDLKLVIEAVRSARATVRVLDARGQSLQQRTVNLSRGQNVIANDVTALANGAYFVQVVIDGAVTTERFVVARQ